MLCAYECHQIGGPWIAENPNCPEHGSKRDYIAQNYEDSVRDILYRLWCRQINADAAYDELQYL